MRLRPGDRLRCANPECRLQVIVTELRNGKETETLLRCSCGSPMKKFYEKPAMNWIKLDRPVSAELECGTPGNEPEAKRKIVASSADRGGSRN